MEEPISNYTTTHQGDVIMYASLKSETRLKQVIGLG